MIDGCRLAQGVDAMPIEPALAARLRKYETTAVQYSGTWKGKTALLAFSATRLILIGTNGEEAVSYRTAKIIESDGASRTVQFHGVSCTFIFDSELLAQSFDANLARQTTGLLAAPGSVPEPIPSLLVVTMNDIPGYRIDEVHGDVFGLIVRARNYFSNVGANLRTIVGGEVGGYTTLLTESRVEARERMMAEARALGANAVVAMRFDCNEIGGIMSEIACYGTAVTASKLSGTDP